MTAQEETYLEDADRLLLMGDFNLILPALSGHLTKAEQHERQGQLL